MLKLGATLLLRGVRLTVNNGRILHLLCSLSDCEIRLLLDALVRSWTSLIYTSVYTVVIIQILKQMCQPMLALQEMNKAIDGECLSACCSIIETCIDAVEESTIVDEQQATAISCSVQRTVSFLIDFLIAADDLDLTLDTGTESVIYRLCCRFISIGGGDTLHAAKLQSLILHLLRICWYAPILSHVALLYRLLSISAATLHLAFI